MAIENKDCFTDLTLDNQLYEIAKAIESIDPSGVGGTAYYGQVSRITSGIINIATAGTYQSTGLTATLDAENVGVSLGTTDLFAVKNTSGSAQLLKIYGSADIDAGNNRILGIKLALNGTPIDNTECNASTGQGTTFAKLVTNWMIELQPNDEVALFVTNKTTAGNVTLLRGRLVASTVGKQGPEGPQGPTGPAATSTDVQVFTSSATWTKPVGAKNIEVQVIGGGGGGGSGRRGTTASGGGGGSGGGFSIRSFPASTVSSSVTVTVGAGGIGGASQLNIDTNGFGGTAGGYSEFGSLIYAIGGFGGGGGTTTTAAGGGFANRANFTGQQGGQGSTAAGALGGNSTGYAGSGGGGGGGITASTHNNGGNGGASLGSFSSGVALGGTTDGASGQQGRDISSPLIGSGDGGGGGASSTGSGGGGGNGGSFGSGGGGGGGANGNSGAGGNGAAGIVVVTTYF